MLTDKRSASGKAVETRVKSERSEGVAVKSGGTGSKLETCHPSVCIGEAKPTSCVCPPTKK